MADNEEARMAHRGRGEFETPAHKMSIARKEARESRYWLRIVRAAILDRSEFCALEQESDELVRILSAIIANANKS